ncbi:unnamed protein product [Polarella glacialis]|nr:unnamed protein product [Polarella glacialis]
MTDRECRMLFDAADKDKNEKVDFDEFVAWIFSSKDLLSGSAEGPGRVAAGSGSRAVTAMRASVSATSLPAGPGSRAVTAQPASASATSLRSTSAATPDTSLAKTRTHRAATPVDGIGEPGKLQGHPLLALSVRHISVAILEKVAAAGLDRNAKVYAIEPLVIRPAGESQLCPRDKQQGAAYVDSVGYGPDDVGLASIMLSYSWGYGIGDIADTLIQHCTAPDTLIQLEREKRTCVWMCCFCINQQRVKQKLAAGDTVPFEDFSKEFKTRVEGIGHVLAMMQPWREPLYIKRVWCNFEFFSALSEDVEVTIAMPPCEAADFLESLERGSGIQEMWQVLGALTVEAAEASVPQDKENILRLISHSPGFHDFNSAVATQLQQWIVSISEEHLHRAVAARSCPAQSAAAASTEQSSEHRRFLQLQMQVGNLQLKVGNPARAMEIFQKACEQLSAEGPDAPASWHATLLRCLGSAKSKMHDLDGAERAYQEALRVESTEDKPAQNSWERCNSSGTLQMQRGDSAGALVMFQEALRLSECDGGCDDMDVATILMNLGSCLAKAGSLDEAYRSYKRVRQIYEAAGSMETPEGASLLSNLGNVENMGGDVAAALTSYRAARQMFERLGIMESPGCASTLVNLAIVQGRSGDILSALEAARAAQAIFKKLGMLDTPLWARAQQIIDLASRQEKLNVG